MVCGADPRLLRGLAIISAGPVGPGGACTAPAAPIVGGGVAGSGFPAGAAAAPGTIETPTVVPTLGGAWLTAAAGAD